MQIIELLPLIAFFAAYWLSKDLLMATAILMIATIAITGFMLLRKQKLSKQHIFTIIMVLGFGSITLVLQDKTIIQYKPTLVNYALALLVLGFPLVTKKTFVEWILQGKLILKKKQYLILSLLWAVFFVCIGTVNIFIVLTGNEELWVNFRFFGILSMTFLLALVQGGLIYYWLHSSRSSYE